MKMQNNNIIKVPNNISFIYCNKKKIIVFSSSLQKKSLKIKLRLIIFNSKKLIKVSLLPFSNISNTEKKNLKSLQKTTVALIKQLIIEVLTTIHQKLKLIGVGYRSINVETFKDQLILFKIGFSHFIYFKIPKKINFFCKKQTQLFILGTSYQDTTQIAANIRAIKKPEPYKGKGILYANEIIKTKKGKKI